MRTLLRRLGTAVLFLLIFLCLAPSAILPFLDRAYYDGPGSAHFDGERFFNPGASPPRSDSRRGGNFLKRLLRDGSRPAWPQQVAVSAGVPPRHIEPGGMVATWIGHATVLIQTPGLNILTDPVWSDVVSPFPPFGPARVRVPGVRFEDLPRIGLVIVSHNHYDHMDLPTLKRLWERDRPLIVSSLGNDTILRKAGIEARSLDWGGSLELPGGAAVTVLRNHHWSSRWGTDRNRALWSAFAVSTPSGKVFFAGDTGWGDGSWVDEAAAQGPYRLAIIPIGAYLPRQVMRESHIDPAEAVAVYEKLRPAAALGMHWGTFRLTFEDIDDPPRRLAALRRARGIPADRFRVSEVGLSFAVPAR